MQELSDNEKPVNLSETAIKQIKKASGWMIFLSVIGFMMTVLVLLGAIAAFQSENLAQILGVVYLLAGVAGFFINLFWLQSAIYFRKYAREPDMSDIENALIKFNSSIIFSSIVIVLYIVFIVVIVATGEVGTLMFGNPV